VIDTFLDNNTLTVNVHWEDQHWDALLSLDVNPRRSAGGYICECCEPEERKIFRSIEALWRDHLFDPLLNWINGELASADAIGLYGSPSQGWMSAKLLSEDDLRRAEPDIRIPARVPFPKVTNEDEQP
jgi:hypothetical protein